MYFIAQGWIKLIANDKRTVIDTLTKGQHFGEIGVIYENVERLWYAQADTFSTVYILTKNDMDKVVRKNYP